MEKAYDRVKGEVLWQVLRMYNMGSKLLNGIKSMYVNILAYLRAKGDETDCFRIDRGVIKWFIMSPLAFQ